jgi:hypothetical protein
MPGWLYAVALKGLIAMVIAVGYYVLILLPLRALHRRLPDNGIVRFLFRERGSQGAGSATGTRQRVLDDPPLIGRE